jgi:hypothetical protein
MKTKYISRPGPFSEGGVPPMTHGRVLPHSKGALACVLCMSVGAGADRGETDFTNTLSVG